MLNPEQRANLSNTHRMVIDNLAQLAANEVQLCKLMKVMGEPRLAELHAEIAEGLIRMGEKLQAEEPGYGQDRKAG